MAKITNFEKCFNSHLRITLLSLRVFPICLDREAMHLQCFHVRCALLETCRVAMGLPSCFVWQYSVWISGN